MAEISLSPADLRVITPLLRGCKRPAAIRPGTWQHLTIEPCPLVIDMSELRALLDLRPCLFRSFGLVGKPAEVPG